MEGASRTAMVLKNSSKRQPARQQNVALRPSHCSPSFRSVPVLAIGVDMIKVERKLAAAMRRG
jgi:hypothetical protein